VIGLTVKYSIDVFEHFLQILIDHQFTLLFRWHLFGLDHQFLKQLLFFFFYFMLLLGCLDLGLGVGLITFSGIAVVAG
jgi:membrane-anchored glycerophosphoryl diester phosphodiesterase (GDPDase)